MVSPEIQAEQRQQDFVKSTKAQSDTGEEGFISASFLKWATSLLLAYFGARLVFFALNISSFVPPDEVTHAGLCKIFSKTFLLPTNSPETYQFGLVTNTPWLYYWTMGKLLHLNFFGLSDLVFLRLLNIPLAFATVWYAVRLLLLLTDNRLCLLLLIVAMTNTPMFSLLSASVSYDNLANLLAAMAIYYQFAFFRNRSAGLIVASLLCQMAGSLTKNTLLPLILILNVLLFINEWRNLLAFPSAVRQYFRTSTRSALLKVLLLFVAAGLNLQLYAGNYLHYGALNPAMEYVLSPRIAKEHGVDARGIIFNQYKEGKIPYMDALILAGEIEHPGDKSDTFYLLMNYENLKRNPQLWMGPLSYVKFWFQNMLATIFGIKAHLGMFKPPLFMLPVYLVFALAALGFLIRWRPMESGWISPGLAAIAVCYAGYLMYMVNYDSYLNYGEPGLTMYGRYLFLLIAPVYVLLCHYQLRLFRTDYNRCALAMATALLFISYDFPWFLTHATAEWYTWLPS
ncbi:MAG TPA: hypothetical protein VHN12_10795 [Geobacteraceae bacterium]|nr:hypothetical protein [Geobacteraceae bacterium]